MTRSDQSKAGTPRARRSGGFTLAEVAVAGVVLALGITGALLVLQRGFQSLDTARSLTSATQIMQDEMERLRLRTWTDLQQLQDSRESAVAVEPSAAAGRFRCMREIRDLKTDMKEIVLTASWRGTDGRAHAASLITRYCRNGINDYYYTIR